MFSVFSVDLDNDGDIDVVATNRSANSVSIFMNLTPVGIHEIRSPKPLTFSFPSTFTAPLSQ